MKICSMCKESKSVELFSVRNSASDGRQAYCKECGKKHYKSWKNQSEARKNRHADWKKDRIATTRQKLVSYLNSHPCVDCGNSDIRVLEFDHVRGTKSAGVTELLNRGHSWDKIEEEIQKCQVRCCNCHRIMTINRGKFWLMAP